jgi:ABC-2 type transport system permease protein
MHKLWLIIKREYLVRVRKKSFLLITLLAPIAFATITFGIGFMTAYMSEKSEKKILVRDDSGIFEKHRQDTNKSHIYTFTNEPLDSINATYSDKGFDIFTYIPSYNDTAKNFKIQYHSVENPGIITIEKIESDIAGAFKEYKIEKSKIDRAVLESFFVDITLQNADEIVEGKDSAGKLPLIIATALAFVMGFLLYMVIFIFGSLVMRSVMEEKVNRIVEVMISSVKPFQLMMGKVIGVGGVGLTQLFIWIIFIPMIMAIANAIFGTVPQTGMTGIQPPINPADMNEFSMKQFIDVFFSMNWGLILPSFILFFLGGYFLYSSMFAAVGAAIGDDQGESQSLIWPITVPVILGFIIMMNSVENPNSPMAIFGSIFPLFSPLVMPARLPFNPPVWQVIVSLIVLFLTCVLFIWISAKIYRGGILLYGKKLTLKEMGKILINKL